MSYKDLFAVGVRLVGVWLVTRGIVYVAAFVDGKLYPAFGSSSGQRRRT